MSVFKKLLKQESHTYFSHKMNLKTLIFQMVDPYAGGKLQHTLFKFDREIKSAQAGVFPVNFKYKFTRLNPAFTIQ